jgi:hypothetical protein
MHQRRYLVHSEVYQVQEITMIGTHHECEFPFEEIREVNGDYFRTRAAVKKAGFEDSQTWSVIECDGAYSFGPPHHYVNLLGYIATTEHHDNNTYYHERAEDYS